MNALAKQYTSRAAPSDTRYFNQLVYDAAMDLRAGRITFAFTEEQVDAIQARYPKCKVVTSSDMFTLIPKTEV